jgi:hypothetical protein
MSTASHKVSSLRREPVRFRDEPRGGRPRPTPPASRRSPAHPRRPTSSSPAPARCPRTRNPGAGAARSGRPRRTAPPAGPGRARSSPPSSVRAWSTCRETSPTPRLSRTCQKSPWSRSPRPPILGWSPATASATSVPREPCAPRDGPGASHAHHRPRARAHGPLLVELGRGVVGVRPPRSRPGRRFGPARFAGDGARAAGPGSAWRLSRRELRPLAAPGRGGAGRFLSPRTVEWHLRRTCAPPGAASGG